MMSAPRSMTASAGEQYCCPLESPIADELTPGVNWIQLLQSESGADCPTKPTTTSEAFKPHLAASKCLKYKLNQIG